MSMKRSVHEFFVTGENVIKTVKLLYYQVTITNKRCFVEDDETILEFDKTKVTGIEHTIKSQLDLAQLFGFPGILGLLLSPFFEEANAGVYSFFLALTLLAIFFFHDIERIQIYITGMRKVTFSRRVWFNFGKRKDSKYSDFFKDLREVITYDD